MGVLADLADELKYDRERQLQFGAFRASTPPPPAKPRPPAAPPPPPTPHPTPLRRHVLPRAPVRLDGVRRLRQG